MKLTDTHRCNLAADMLRDIATQTLGAARCSSGYLNALSYVLGNQAKADRTGALLEMNTVVPFATARTMRTILSQLESRGMTFRLHRDFGAGRVQAVSFYQGRPHGRLPAHEELERVYRHQEAEDDKRQQLDLRGLDGTKRARWMAASADHMAALRINEADIPQ